jgi:hypothetical protein
MQPRFRTLAALVTLGLALCVPSAAHATITELGTIANETAPVPSCPDTDGDGPIACQVVTRTTAYQTKVGAKKNFMTATKNGRIVAWTVSLASPSADETSFFTDSGTTASGSAKAALGKPSAGLAVLRPGTKLPLYSRTVLTTPVYDLSPYMGKTVQFALEKSIPVKKGRIIALNVPSWAPILSIADQPATTSWRGARPADRCGGEKLADGTFDTAAFYLPSTVTLGKIGNYNCLYQNARLTYSVTIVNDPTPAPTKVSDTGAPVTPVTSTDTTTTR